MPRAHRSVQSKRVSIVIPTLNEGKNIGKLIPKIKSELEGYTFEIIVVDGHSKDDTVKVAEQSGARIMYDEIGKGSALMKGLKNAKGEILVSMDADLSNEPRELKLLIGAIDIGYDIGMGSRFLIGGGSEDIPLIRRLGNEFFVRLVNLFFHSNYTDLCYGYRSFKRGVLQRLDLKETGFGIEAEISIKAIKRKMSIIEIPSAEKKRVHGEGKLRTFGDGFVILKTILGNIF